MADTETIVMNGETQKTTSTPAPTKAAPKSKAKAAEVDTSKVTELSPTLTLVQS
jgi:hypothetical protein